MTDNVLLEKEIMPEDILVTKYIGSDVSASVKKRYRKHGNMQKGGVFSIRVGDDSCLDDIQKLIRIKVDN